MRIADLLQRGRPTISFEFMAPRDESEVEALEKTITKLAGDVPDWISVTYRRATGDKTLELVTRIKRRHHIESMAHLTCANTRDETRRILNWMEREGVANVLALRGDPPGPGQAFAPADPALTHGSDLVAFIRRSGYRLGIGAACSAEKHPESPDRDHEFRFMLKKVEAGADFLITQLFFDNRSYFDLVDRARAAGVTIPIVPGLMPVPSRRSLAYMAAMTGATVPPVLAGALERAADDDAVRSLGVEHCIAQCAELLEAGVPGLHFYTFNRARAPIEILGALRGQQLLAS
jgi:methylenetetrahydrofolate reductase (NADPH)